MTMRRAASLATISVAVLLAASCAPIGGQHEHAAVDDSRAEVAFPTPLKEHTLGNMRDHLLTLQRIQDALARGDFDAASHLAESRLGLSSLEAHGAHDVAKFMPQGMQEVGTAMHRSASRFAIEATNAGATGDMRNAIAALSVVTSQCVACHAAYRLK
jgi:hypothetical protein